MTPDSVAPAGAQLRRGPLHEGERVQLTDAKGRPHTIQLAAGKVFHTHRGHLSHDTLIGSDEGVYGFRFNGQRYDCGSKAGFLQATVAFGLDRADLRDDLEAYLHEVIGARKAAQ